MFVLWKLTKLAITLFCLVLLFALGILAFLIWASRGFDPSEPDPGPEVDRALLGVQERPAAPAEITVLTFNIAYGRGSRTDIGDLRDREEIEGILDALGSLLSSAQPDIVALQEVDFDAHRSHHINQLVALAQAAGYPYRAWVTTWRNNYVPYPYWPPSQHFGRMHSGQAVLSRFPILENHRILLPQPASNPWWYNRFYLHRAIQAVTIQVGETELTLYNTHLEAFDVPNREDQAHLLVDLVRNGDGRFWIVLGDMNSPPPEAPQRSGFLDEPGWDASGDRTIEILREGLGSVEVPGLESYLEDQAATFTYPADAPTRRLDYIFTSNTLPVQSSRVITSAQPVSDHLPVVATIRLRPPELPQRRIHRMDGAGDLGPANSEGGPE